MFFAAPWPIRPTPIYPTFALLPLFSLFPSTGGGLDTQSNLEMLRPDRERPAQREVEACDDRIHDRRLERRIGHELSGARQLDEADDRRDRGRLHELDHEADRRRDRDADRLRQDD